MQTQSTHASNVAGVLRLYQTAVMHVCLQRQCQVELSLHMQILSRMKVVLHPATITSHVVIMSPFLQVGVVSDYDLLALDKLGSVKNDKQLFPAADETWQVRAAAACDQRGLPVQLKQQHSTAAGSRSLQVHASGLFCKRICPVADCTFLCCCKDTTGKREWVKTEFVSMLCCCLAACCRRLRR